MSVYYVPIAKCPFCEETKGDGHILIDAAALSKERMNAKARSSPNGDKPEERIFLFNTGREKAGPCEHLMGLWCDVNWGIPHGDIITYEWECDSEIGSSRLSELHKGDEADIFFWDELYCGGGQSGIHPKTASHLSFLGTRWRDLSDPQSTEHYFAVEGRALFVENIDKFMDELHEGGVEFQKWMKEHIPLEKGGSRKDDDEYEEVDVAVV